jgi:hypothetical protein
MFLQLVGLVVRFVCKGQHTQLEGEAVVPRPSSVLRALSLIVIYPSEEYTTPIRAMLVDVTTAMESGKRIQLPGFTCGR